MTSPTAPSEPSWRPPTAVVDASAYLRMLEGHPAAQEWFASAWAGDVLLVAPELILVEVANSFARVQARTHALLGSFEEHLRRLQDAVWILPIEGLLEDAYTLAAERELTAYDALYAALSERLGVTLVTADRELAAVVVDSVFISPPG